MCAHGQGLRQKSDGRERNGGSLEANSEKTENDPHCNQKTPPANILKTVKRGVLRDFKRNKEWPGGGRPGPFIGGAVGGTVSQLSKSTSITSLVDRQRTLPRKTHYPGIGEPFAALAVNLPKLRVKDCECTGRLKCRARNPRKAVCSNFSFRLF